MQREHSSSLWYTSHSEAFVEQEAVPESSLLSSIFHLGLQLKTDYNSAAMDNYFHHLLIMWSIKQK